MANYKDIFSRKIVCFWDHTVTQNGSGYWIEPIKLKVLQIVIGKFRKVILCCRVSEDKIEGKSQIPPNIVIFPLAQGHLPKTQLGYLGMLLCAILPIVRYVRESQLVYCRHQGIPFFHLASLMAVLMSKPLLVSVGGDVKKSFLLRKGMNKAPGIINQLKAFLLGSYDRWIARKADLALVSGERLNETLGHHGFSFSSDAFSASDIYPRTDTCGGNVIRWLFTGTISLEKGVDTLIRALALTRKHDSRHVALLVGKQNTPPKWVLDLIHELCLDDFVSYRGTVSFGPALFELYRKSDLFVFPSIHEGMPKSPMEALSQGLPVICTKTGGGEYIRNGFNGIHVSTDNYMDISQAVEEVISNKELRKNLIANGLSTAIKNTFEIQMERVGELIRTKLYSRFYNQSHKISGVKY